MPVKRTTPNEKKLKPEKIIKENLGNIIKTLDNFNYEYKVMDSGFLYTSGPSDLQVMLNDIAKEGWRLVLDLNGEKVIFERRV